MSEQNKVQNLKQRHIMTNSLKSLVAIAVISFGLCSCSTMSDVEDNMVPMVASVGHSGCKGDPDNVVHKSVSKDANGMDDADITKFSFALAGNTLSFGIEDVIMNCGVETVDLSVNLKGKELVLILGRTGNSMNCVCLFDITSEITNFKPGEYTVSVYVKPMVDLMIPSGTDDGDGWPVFSEKVVIEDGYAAVVEKPCLWI